MTDNDQLAQRYADLLELDAAFLPLVGELDAAAAPYRTLEPPPTLDQAIEGLARQRASTNRPLPEAIEPDPEATAPPKPRDILPERLRRGYMPQLLGMAAAIAVVVLFAGLIAALLRGPGGQSGVGGAVTTTSQLPTPNANGEYLKMTLAQARQLVNFPIIEPDPLPDVLHPLPDSSVTVATMSFSDSTQPNYVAFSYPAQDTADHGITLVQTTVQAVVPTNDGVSLHWVDQNGKPVTIKYQGLILNKLSIAGVTVTKLDTMQDDGRVIYASWQKDGVIFVATSGLGPHVTARVFDQFIAALIAPGATIATPQATVPAEPPLSPAERGAIPFAEAQKQASFYLAEPTWLPSYLVAQDVLGLKTDGQLTVPTLFYGPPDGSQSYGVQIVEYTEDHHARPPGTLEVLTIAGHVVAHSTATVDGSMHSFFVWHDQGTIFQLDAHLAGPLTEQDTEKMVTSMLGGNAATPNSSSDGSALPTPNANGAYVGLTLAQAQQLAPFKIVMPIDISPSLTFSGLSLSIPPEAPAGLAKGVPNIAGMRFISTDEPHWFVEIDELWVGPHQPETPTPPVTSASGTPTVPADLSLPPTFQIGGVTITKDVTTNAGGQPVASYKWTQGEAMIWLAMSQYDVQHEPAIYAMIASMIAQGD